MTPLSVCRRSPGAGRGVTEAPLDVGPKGTREALYPLGEGIGDRTHAKGEEMSYPNYPDSDEDAKEFTYKYVLETLRHCIDNGKPYYVLFGDSPQHPGRCASASQFNCVEDMRTFLGGLLGELHALASTGTNAGVWAKAALSEALTYQLGMAPPSEPFRRAFATLLERLKTGRGVYRRNYPAHQHHLYNRPESKRDLQHPPILQRRTGVGGSDQPRFQLHARNVGL